MTAVIEDLLLEHLKRFQAWHDRIERDLKVIKAWLSTLAFGQESLLQLIRVLGLFNCVTVSRHRFFERAD